MWSDLHKKEKENEVIIMTLSLDLKSMLNPVHRLVVGVIFIILGILSVTGLEWYTGTTREQCLPVTAEFKSCKFHSTQTDYRSDSIYLTFTDHDDRDIHSSCLTAELEQKLFDLKAGTKITMLVNENTNTIYELKANGETLLDFDTAKKTIDKNVTIVKYLGYVFLPFGGLCAVSAVIQFIVRAVSKPKHS